ncbi:hypothetical protein CHARACLAT_033699 [Characodon lateralis]|uniref:Uncharacterized protein n=1 Tax=Characodon lateralis TaxID=208331 RepID=A0ABU7CTE2_9TELE|nr:hypothetical protein [Characodon lateralis]
MNIRTHYTLLYITLPFQDWTTQKIHPKVRACNSQKDAKKPRAPSQPLQASVWMMYMFKYSLLGRVASHHVGENQEAYWRKHLRATVKHGGVGMMIRVCLTKTEAIGLTMNFSFFQNILE